MSTRASSPTTHIAAALRNEQPRINSQFLPQQISPCDLTLRGTNLDKCISHSFLGFPVLPFEICTFSVSSLKEIAKAKIRITSWNSSRHCSSEVVKMSWRAQGLILEGKEQRE